MTHFTPSLRRRRARDRKASAAAIIGPVASHARRKAAINIIGPASVAIVAAAQKLSEDGRIGQVGKSMPSGADSDAGTDVSESVNTGSADRGAPDLDGPDLDDQDSGASERQIAALTLMVAELQRAKDAAEAANEAKTRYLVSVNHEIRSPLNAIYGYAQLLERGGAISAAEAGGVIRRSAEHLTNLIEGILEISRIESGVLTVRQEVVEFPTLLAQVMDMFRMQAKAKGIELRFENDGRLPRFVRTDEKRLRQILINLLSNAIKYTRAGSVTLCVAYRSQVADIRISDTGIGIPPEELDLIFDPFERGSSAQAALQPGVGLGLAITRALARILGGEVVATSTPGVGSCFHLAIFLAEPFTPPVDAGDYRHISGYHGPRRTVLVIDDDPSQANILDSLLRQLGFVVYTAGNGTEGLALADRCRPDLVLLDMHMPGIGGSDVAARLRIAFGDAIAIVMVSAQADAATAAGQSAANHDAYLSKPVDQKKLLAVIGDALQLSWDFAGDNLLDVVAALPPALPKGAEKQLRRIRELAKIGHIRAVEAALGDLASDLPASAPAVAVMREYVGQFDLASLVKMLDGHEYR